MNVYTEKQSNFWGAVQNSGGGVFAKNNFFVFFWFVKIIIYLCKKYKLKTKKL